MRERVGRSRVRFTSATARKAGAKSSPKKTLAAVANGKKGGRPLGSGEYARGYFEYVRLELANAGMDTSDESVAATYRLWTQRRRSVSHPAECETQREAPNFASRPSSPIRPARRRSPRDDSQIARGLAPRRRRFGSDAHPRQVLIPKGRSRIYGGSGDAGPPPRGTDRTQLKPN
jgi:hypothetical protein